MYGSIEAIKEANQAAGQHWFDDDTMSLFGSRVESGVLAGRWFITSESKPWGGVRRFTIRMANDDGTIATVGDFGAYVSLNEAHMALAAL